MALGDSADPESLHAMHAWGDPAASLPLQPVFLARYV